MGKILVSPKEKLKIWVCFFEAFVQSLSDLGKILGFAEPDLVNFCRHSGWSISTEYWVL